MDFLALHAPPLLARSATALRPLARRVATAIAMPSPELVEHARTNIDPEPVIGRVQSGGAWSDGVVHGALVRALDPLPGLALRQTFEWYQCRGAFFHTDAHYADVLFGVWYIDGPPVDIVFARASLRVAARPGTIVVFDPFEVHGVLLPGATEYRADDHAGRAASVFVGFELELDDAVRAAFELGEPAADARLISSSTRVMPTTGAFESPRD
jgi:phage terminase large subunit-like protein